MSSKKSIPDQLSLIIKHRKGNSENKSIHFGGSYRPEVSDSVSCTATYLGHIQCRMSSKFERMALMVLRFNITPSLPLALGVCDFSQPAPPIIHTCGLHALLLSL